MEDGRQETEDRRRGTEDGRRGTGDGETQHPGYPSIPEIPVQNPGPKNLPKAGILLKSDLIRGTGGVDLVEEDVVVRHVELQFHRRAAAALGRALRDMD